MSTVEVDTIEINGSIGFDRLGFETPVAIPGDGILVVYEDQGSSITLGSGTLRGIRFLTPEGEPVVLANDQTRTKVLRTAVGATVTLVHNDTVNVAEPTERILVSSLQNIPLGPVNTFVFFGYTMAFSQFRWFVGDAEMFAPTVAADWPMAVPTRFSGALDQLAARAPERVFEASGSVAITSSVATTLWSIALAEGQVVGGRAEVTAGFVSAGSTQRSRGYIDFGASRSVGGAAAVTSNDTAENGTIPSGAVSIVASTNDALVQVTYATTGTLTYKVRVVYDVLNIPQ